MNEEVLRDSPISTDIGREIEEEDTTNSTTRTSSFLYMKPLATLEIESPLQYDLGKKITYEGLLTEILKARNATLEAETYFLRSQLSGMRKRHKARCESYEKEIVMLHEQLSNIQERMGYTFIAPYIDDTEDEDEDL